MRIQQNRIDNKNVIQIYLNEQEERDDDIKNKIKDIQEDNKNVVLFVSGDNEVSRTLKEMIKIMRNETITM